MGCTGGLRTDTMITVVARWEDTQMPADIEYQLYRQLRGSFCIDRFIFTPVVETEFNVEQCDNMMTALLKAGDGERVFLEPTGYNPVSAIPQGDIVIVIGNSAMNNMQHARVNETYSISTESGPTKSHLYGSNALAIALAERWGQ